MMKLFKALLTSVVLLNTVTFALLQNEQQHSRALDSSRHIQNIRALVHRAQEKEKIRRGRRLTDSVAFVLICDSYQAFADEDDNFTCSCDTPTRTLTCSSIQYCEDGECATVQVEFDFTSGFELDFLDVCITYVGDAASRYPDVCVRVDSDEATDTNTCTVELESNGALEPCRTCEFCTVNGEEGLNLDCTNLYVNATTEGCAEDGDDVVDSTRNFSVNSPVRIVQQRAVMDDSSSTSSTSATDGTPVPPTSTEGSSSSTTSGTPASNLGESSSTNGTPVPPTTTSSTPDDSTRDSASPADSAASSSYWMTSLGLFMAFVSMQRLM